MLLPTNQNPSTSDTMMITWSVWVSIHALMLPRKAWARLRSESGVQLHRDVDPVATRQNKNKAT